MKMITIEAVAERIREIEPAKVEKGVVTYTLRVDIDGHVVDKCWADETFTATVPFATVCKDVGVDPENEEVSIYEILNKFADMDNVNFRNVVYDLAKRANTWLAKELAKDMNLGEHKWAISEVAEFCEMAGLREELAAADDDTFERVIERAADILGVEIFRG